MIGVLREAGFSLPLSLHAHILLDSYTYGFALQETSLPVATDAESDAFATEIGSTRCMQPNWKHDDWVRRLPRSSRRIPH